MIHSIGATFRRLAVTRWMVFAIAALASLSIVLPPISTVAQAPMANARPTFEDLFASFCLIETKVA